MYLYILLSLCAFLIYGIKKRREYWKNRNVPYVEGISFLANLRYSAFKYNIMSKTYGDIYNRFRNYKYCGMMNFTKPTLLILDPDLIGVILAKNFGNFHDNLLVIEDKEEPMLTKYLFLSKGESWKRTRDQLVKHFTAGKVKNMFPRMVEACGKLERFLEKQIDTSQNLGINALELGTKFAADVAISYTFNLDGRFFADDNNKIIKMFGKMVDTSLSNRILFLIKDVLPGIRKIKVPRLFTLEFSKWFESFVLDEMKARGQKQFEKDDFLEAAMKMTNDATISESAATQAAGYLLTFLVDAIGTFTLVLHYALCEIGANLDVQEKLQKECDNLLQCDEGLTHEAIQQMPYLDMVVMESIRKYPPLLFMARTCTRATKLPPVVKGGDEIQIEAGMDVYIPTKAIHYDPQYYPEPGKFDPHRFAEEAKNGRPKYSFLGFGAGPRTCLGQRFSIVQLKTVIASIVSKFEVRVNEKTMLPLEMDLDAYENVPKGGIWLDFYKRRRPF